MNKRILLTLFLIIIGLTLFAQYVPDDNFRQKINQALNEPIDHEPTIADLNSLTGHFEAIEAEIESIEGAQYLTNLTLLDLMGNQISDISPLANLINLTDLYLEQNQITDTNPLSNLSNLTGLSLRDNQINDLSGLTNLSNLTSMYLMNNRISDLTPLSSLPNLTQLYLKDNRIIDVSPLSALTGLTILDLTLNQISELSALANLTNITNLFLAGNQITDIYPLLENSGLGSGDRLQLYYNNDFDLIISNPLSREAIEEHIPILEGLGFNELSYSDEFQPKAACYPSPSRNSVELSCNSNLFWQASDSSISYEVYLGTTPYNLLLIGEGDYNSETTFTIAPELLSETEYWWRVKSINGFEIYWSGLWDFTTGNNSSLIPDANFRAKIVQALQQPEDYEPTIADLNSLSGHLNAMDAGIYSIEGSQYLTGLATINLGQNHIGDLSHLAYLSNLTQLLLMNNLISDLTPLSNLENLFRLHLHENQITDITPLAELTNLTELRLDSNQIIDISIISGFQNLSDLRLQDNLINDISALANLTQLNWLMLYDNQITDIFPLVENNGLGFEDYLYLKLISPISMLSTEAIEVHIPILESRGFNIFFYHEYSAPSAPCYPFPARHAEDVGYGSTLSWEGNSSITACEVFLGTSNDNLVSIGEGYNLEEGPFGITPELLPNTEYWWRVKSTHQYYQEIYWSGLWHFTTGSSVSLTDETVEEPQPVQLSAYPNPFNPSTTISFSTEQYGQNEQIELAIFNIKGQRVKTYPVTLSAPMQSECIEGRQSHSIIWHGTDQNNNPVASGIYFFKLKVDGKAMAVSKCVLLK